MKNRNEYQSPQMKESSDGLFSWGSVALTGLERRLVTAVIVLAVLIIWLALTFLIYGVWK